MFDDLFYPNERKGLWTKEMVLLSLSNLLLYISLYIFLPSLPYWLSEKIGSSLMTGSLIMASFAIAIFVPGPFNNYLLDAFKRKRVGFWAFVLLGISSLGYKWAVSLWVILFIRLLQGFLFSIISTATGSTLVIDVTPTKKRTLANLTYSRVGRIGMVTGVLAGIYIFREYGMDYIIYISCSMAILAGFILLMIRVPFRAPLKPSLCSLDRFLLPRALPAALNMIFTPIIIGIIISYVDNEQMFVAVAVGSVLGYLLANNIFQDISGRTEVQLSTLSLVCGYLLIAFTDSPFIVSSGFILLGIGTSLSANRFYIIIISLPLHCERGSANNTFNLFWEVGIFAGILLGCLFGTKYAELRYIIPILLTLLSLLIYELFTHKWYYRVMEK